MCKHAPKCKVTVHIVILNPNQFLVMHTHCRQDIEKVLQLSPLFKAGLMECVFKCIKIRLHYAGFYISGLNV